MPTYKYEVYGKRRSWQPQKAAMKWRLIGTPVKLDEKMLNAKERGLFVI